MKTKSKQRGYFHLDGIGTVLGCIAGIILVVGIAIGLGLPVFWGWFKPWLHSITG